MSIRWRLHRKNKASFVRRGLGSYDGCMLFESDRLRSITWVSAGYQDVARWPIMASGFYILPVCDAMCCRPKGPFRTTKLALRAIAKEYGKAPRHPHPALDYHGGSIGWRRLGLPAMLLIRRLRRREKQLVTAPWF